MNPCPYEEMKKIEKYTEDMDIYQKALIFSFMVGYIRAGGAITQNNFPELFWLAHEYAANSTTLN